MSGAHTLLVHATRHDDHFGPLGPSSGINTMAVGMPALAAAVEGAGRSVELLHTGVEWLEDPSWTIEAEVRATRPRLVGLSLHWHPQTHAVIRAARAIKAADPRVKVLLGGLTATVFADEILSQHPEVDLIIRGDGELPLVRLLGPIDRGGPLEEVPNLSFRSAGRVRHNPIGHVADAASLSQLGFERLDLLRHHRRYIREVAGLHYVPHHRGARLLMRAAQTLFGGSGRYFVLPAGRGCTVACAWCGGGWGAHRAHTGRVGVTQVHPGRLSALIARAVELGFSGVHACFDPHPHDPRHWIEVCERLRLSAVSTELLFESFGLPTDGLLTALARTFSRRVVAISPESPIEAVRRKVRGFSFTNDELVDAVGRCGRAGVDVMLCFGYGLPGETASALDAVQALVKRCQAVIGRRRLIVRAFPIQMEPAAPWSEQPARFGIEPTRRSFADYLHAHTPGATGPQVGLGYRHAGYFEAGADAAFEERLQTEACARLCPLPPSPRLGRFTCAALRGLRGERRACGART